MDRATDTSKEHQTFYLPPKMKEYLMNAESSENVEHLAPQSRHRVDIPGIGPTIVVFGKTEEGELKAVTFAPHPDTSEKDYDKQDPDAPIKYLNKFRASKRSQIAGCAMGLFAMAGAFGCGNSPSDQVNEHVNNGNRALSPDGNTPDFASKSTGLTADNLPRIDTVERFLEGTWEYGRHNIVNMDGKEFILFTDFTKPRNESLQAIFCMDTDLLKDCIEQNPQPITVEGIPETHDHIGQSLVYPKDPEDPTGEKYIIYMQGTRAYRRNFRFEDNIPTAYGEREEINDPGIFRQGFINENNEGNTITDIGSGMRRKKNLNTGDAEIYEESDSPDAATYCGTAYCNAESGFCVLGRYREDARGNFVACEAVIAETLEGLLHSDWYLKRIERNANGEPTGNLLRIDASGIVAGDGIFIWRGADGLIYALEAPQAEPEPPILDQIDYSQIPNPTVPHGTSEIEARAQLPGIIDITAMDGTPEQATIIWLIPGYDGETPGDYTAIGTITLPAGWETENGETTIQIERTITVSEELTPTIIDIDPNNNIQPLTAPYGTTSMEIFAQMPNSIEVTIEEDGATRTETISISQWTFPNGYNQTALNSYLLRATLSIPTDKQLTVGLENFFDTQVHVVPAEVIRTETLNPISVDHGTPFSSLPLPSVIKVTYETLTGTEKEEDIEVEWNTSTYNPTTPGEQTISSTWKNYPGYLVPIPAPKATVTVGEPEVVNPCEFAEDAIDGNCSPSNCDEIWETFDLAGSCTVNITMSGSETVEMTLNDATVSVNLMAETFRLTSGEIEITTNGNDIIVSHGSYNFGPEGTSFKLTTEIDNQEFDIIGEVIDGKIWVEFNEEFLRTIEAGEGPVKFLNGVETIENPHVPDTTHPQPDAGSTDTENPLPDTEHPQPDAGHLPPDARSTETERPQSDTGWEKEKSSGGGCSVHLATPGGEKQVPNSLLLLAVLGGLKLVSKRRKPETIRGKVQDWLKRTFSGK
jgi:hypothetical protein